MAERTGISWTDHTFNPWWGCTKVSPGCANCYAERDAKRYGHDIWGPGKRRRIFGTKHWSEPHRWNRVAEREGIRKRVFCASMADIFEDEALIGERNLLFDTIDATPHLDWQLLTKRPENFASGLPARWLASPPPNVWLGVSVEDQKTADERIPLLLSAPAAVRFVSYEPALGPVDFGRWLAPKLIACWKRGYKPTQKDVAAVNQLARAASKKHGSAYLDWLIVGGESGHGARPFDLAWGRSAVRQCKAAGVAVFVKQLGARPYSSRTASPSPDFFGDNGYFMKLRDAKGSKIDEWPHDLRVQEFPRDGGT